MRSTLAIVLQAVSLSAAEPVTYNRDVRPILSENCFFCHGPDKNKRKADLRLDVREVALEKEAFVPGKPGESELIARISKAADAEGAMPPAEAHKTLTAKQKEILKAWIEQGAKYEPHWAYVPLKSPGVPSRKSEVETAIDAFIRMELEKKGLKLSPEADRRTLIRRVYLDLIGLPPSVEKVEEFINDQSPDAYEKLVDSLLAMPEFGERLAVMWLDQVRFADTVGYHGDQNQRIFPYRDYVIQAFAKNKPFDQFTREQLAGDLLPKPTTEQLVATGFHRLNMMTREGGAQPKEYYAKYQADRVRTVSLAFLGSTMGCCECHDHKYDPFTAKDFYSMSAFFADIRQWGVYADYTYTPNPDLKGWNNDMPFPPEIEVESDYLKQRKTRLTERLSAAAAEAAKKLKADGARKKWREFEAEFVREHPTGWATPTPVIDAGGTVQKDRSVLVTAKAAKDATTTITLKPPPGWLNAIKLELLPHARHGGKIVRNNATTTTVTPTLTIAGKDGKPRKVALYYGEADHSTPLRWYSTEPTPGLLNGWRSVAGRVAQPHTAVWLLDKPIVVKDGDELTVAIKNDNAGCVRISVSPFAWPDLSVTDYFKFTERNAKDAIVEEQADASGGDALLELLSTGTDAAFLTDARAILKELHATNHGKAWTQVSVPQKPQTTRILPRGNWMDESAPVVLPATPGFLGGPASTDQKRLTRLDLADWIVSPENPLTARVFVNRLWKLFLGTGLSAGVEDLGAQGEWPSHPELLDWLACEFRNGWDVKRTVKLIVMSQTYRQQSKAKPEALAIDPANRLLSFLPPRRLEAEFVRDNALAIAGLLDRDLGGPSAKPYQPAGYYANLQFPDRTYKADADHRQYRRGLYVHWQRTFLHPMLANFDAPSREECTALRTTANTPQQALTLLNDPTFVEAARVLAVKVRAAADTDATRLDWLFQRALARSPKPAEKESLLAFLAKQRDHYRVHPDEAQKLLKVGLAPAPAEHAEDTAAWTALCRVVLNLHESITRY